MRPSGRTQGVLSCSILADKGRIWPPSASQRQMLPTWVDQQLTHRLARVVTKAMPPSGSQQGSIVVELAVGDAAQAGAVGIDDIEQVVLRAAFAVGEEDPLAVVMHGRIADAALRVVDQQRELAGPQVQLAELAEFAVHRPAAVGGPVADVGVPVFVQDAPGGEDDLLHVAHRPGEELGAQVGRFLAAGVRGGEKRHGNAGKQDDKIAATNPWAHNDLTSIKFLQAVRS